MKQFCILFLCLAIMVCAVGCWEANVNLETPPATSLSTPSTTTAGPTTQPAPPPTTESTAPVPTIGPTCPPIADDMYWGKYRAKVFSNPTGMDAPVSALALFSDGSCEYKLSIFSSTWPSPTVWSFDGEYVYIGNVESGKYSIFRYEGAEDSSQTKLIFVKSDHDLNDFARLPDGQEFYYEGVVYW